MLIQRKFSAVTLFKQNESTKYRKYIPHMRKYFVLIALCLAIAPFSGAQRLDLQSMSQLHRHEVVKKLPAESKRILSRQSKSNDMTGNRVISSHDRSHKLLPAPLTATSMAFVTIAPGYSADDLRDAGFDVYSVHGDLAIVQVEVNKASEMSELDCVKAMSLQKPVFAQLDKAREEQGVDLIHQGSAEAGLSVPYTGRGVVAGIVDNGIDPHHINFRYANGVSRISYLAWTRTNASGTAVAESDYNYETIGEFITDDQESYHGTHTLGIMGGSYNGPVTVAKPWADPDVSEPAQYLTEDCKYYGVAPQADLAVACGELQDMYIAMGVEKVLNYAEWLRESTGKPWPLVWNMSLGSNVGPHDPNSQMSQFLDLMGERGIICIAAGNEGDLKIGLTKTFTANETSFKTMIFPYGFQYNAEDPESFTARSGSIAIYSADATPFKLKAVIYNRKRGYRVAKNMPVVGDGVGTYYCSSSEYQVESTDIVGDATFCRAFKGYVGVGSKIDEQTGRYYGMVDYLVYNNTETNLNDDYVLGFEVEGIDGQRIDCYGDGLNTWMDNYGQEGFTDGSQNGSISDMAVGHNLIVVGSYNTRNTWPCLDGGTSRYDGDGFIPGGISGFSSFGTLLDGRNLPTVCAPGAAIVSSISWPFAQLNSQEQLNYFCSAKLEEENRTNYWKQEVGTSMATPFMAGTVALWLEANPDLTVSDVKEIIEKTSVRDEQVKAGDPVRWGAGKLNALAGLKEAIRSSSNVPGISVDTHNDRLILSREGDSVYKAFVGNASEITADVFSASGTLVKHSSCTGDEIRIDLTGVAPGIYIINVNGRHSEKIVVK